MKKNVNCLKKKSLVIIHIHFRKFPTKVDLVEMFLVISETYLTFNLKSLGFCLGVRQMCLLTTLGGKRKGHFNLIASVNVKETQIIKK